MCITWDKFRNEILKCSDGSVAKKLNSVSDEMTVFAHYKNPIINCYGNTALWYILIKSVSHQSCF